MLLFSQMNKAGTALMIALGVPFYIAALLAGLASADLFPGAYLVVLFGAFFGFTVAYSKALAAFTRLTPRRPAWQFIAAVLSVQMAILAATLLVLAA